MDDKKINQDNMLILDESGDFKILQGEELLPYKNQPIKSVNYNPTSVKTTVVAPKTNVPASNLPIDTGMEEKMLPPLPPTVRKSTASFYFHPSDEEEVDALAKKFTVPTGKRYSLDKIIRKILDNYHLNFSEEIKKKFDQIIFAFLRDRRTAIETDALLKAKEFSLAGLPENTANSLLDFLKEIKSKIQEAKGLVVNEEVIDQVPGLTEALIRPKETSMPKAIPKVSVPIAEPTPIVSIAEMEHLKESTRQAQTQMKPEPAKAIPQVMAKPSSFFNSSLKFARPERTSSANQMTDVKKGYKLFGQVEELASLTLENFRRFANTPETRAAKVLARINVLAKDSLIKKSAGINAWRQSPIYKMYLAIGQASMEHGLDVKQVIAEYQKEGSPRFSSGAAGKDIISLEEFEAISDLNRQLRF